MPDCSEFLRTIGSLLRDNRYGSCHNARQMALSAKHALEANNYAAYSPTNVNAKGVVMAASPVDSTKLLAIGPSSVLNCRDMR